MVRRTKKTEKPKEIGIELWALIRSMLPKKDIPLTKADIRKARTYLRKEKVDHE